MITLKKPARPNLTDGRDMKREKAVLRRGLKGFVFFMRIIPEG